MMGGRLSVRSEPGKGSEFYFTLPFGLPAEPRTAMTRKLPEHMKDMRVLVADDRELFRKVVEKYVKRP